VQLVLKLNFLQKLRKKLDQTKKHMSLLSCKRPQVPTYFPIDPTQNFRLKLLLPEYAEGVSCAGSVPRAH